MIGRQRHKPKRRPSRRRILPPLLSNSGHRWPPMAGHAARNHMRDSRSLCRGSGVLKTDVMAGTGERKSPSGGDRAPDD